MSWYIVLCVSEMNGDFDWEAWEHWLLLKDLGMPRGRGNWGEDVKVCLVMLNWRLLEICI